MAYATAWTRPTAATTLIGIALFVAACGDGISEEDARIRCDQERDIKTACMTDEAYNQCLTAYGECGDLVEAQAECPERFVCPAED